VRRHSDLNTFYYVRKKYSLLSKRGSFTAISIAIATRWIVRCHPDYTFNIKFTHFDIEAEFDGISIFDFSQEGSRRLVSDVTGVGTTETNTNNLMIKFQSDCDVTMSGFRAVLTAVEKNNNHETTSSASDLPKTTQSTLDTTTYNAEKTTQTDTTTYQEGTSLKMTTPFNLQTTTSVLGYSDTTTYNPEKHLNFTKQLKLTPQLTKNKLRLK